MDTRPLKLANSNEIEFTRQLDWFDPTESKHRVTIVGCGGIGSPVAVFLSKLGVPYLTLVDDDLIEKHNVPNQFYPLTSIGQSKVETLAKMCQVFGTAEITAHKKRIQDAPEALHGIVVTGLDSMSARADVWKMAKANPAVRWLVDGRLNGMTMQLYTVDMNDQKQIGWYEEAAMYSDEDADDLPCTARAVIDVMGFVSSMIVRTVRLIITDQPPEFAQSLGVKTLTSWTTSHTQPTQRTQAQSAPSTLDTTSISSTEVLEDLETSSPTPTSTV